MTCGLLCFAKRGMHRGKRVQFRLLAAEIESRFFSLAARSLQQLGLLNATDIIGGYKAWKDAGLPVKMKPSSSVSLPTSLVP